MPKILVRTAGFSEDLKVCSIAKQSRYTRDFTSHRFYRDDVEATYANGEVLVATQGEHIVGFVYRKDLKRRPLSVVHFMGVEAQYQGRGIGRLMMDFALQNAPHGVIELSCEHSNTAGMKFYPAIGYTPLYESAYGTKSPRPYTRFEKRRTSSRRA